MLYQNFIPLWLNIIPLNITAHFVSNLCVEGHLGSFYLMSIVDNVTMLACKGLLSVGIQSFDYIHVSGISGPYNIF
jgi:hypothetical protein